MYYKKISVESIRARKEYGTAYTVEWDLYVLAIEIR